MDRKSDFLERLVAIGLVVAGCMFEQYILTAVGLMYFIVKM